MKKVTLSIAALALFTASFAQTLDRSIRPKAGPAPVINLKDAQTFTLPNGLKVFVVENHKIPVVSYSFQFDIDPVIPDGKEGLSEFIGSLATAGTKTMTKLQFDEAVDRIGASLAASGGGLFGSSMTKHQSKLLPLMADALMNADFKQDELDKLKKQNKAGLEQAKTEPDAMLGNVSSVLNYGKAHPYAELTTVESIDNITLQDCKNYYTTYYRPNVAYLAVVGDITLAEAKKLVTQYFSKWQKGTVPEAKFPRANFPTSTSVDFVPRENSVQSVIGVTYPVDLKPGSPDVVRVRMMNEILGGSGTGRLFMNLREKHGWTYGSYSSVSPDEEVGNFQAYAKARNAVTDSSVNEILAEMNRIRNEKVDATTLQEMKNYVSGTFAIGLESPQTIARYAINIEKNKLPKDYYKNYLKSVEAVTVDDIQAVAKKYVTPDAARIIVVGDKNEAPKLARFAKDGKINYYDNYGNTIEAPKSAEESKAAVGDVSVKQVYDKYVTALGGKTVIEGLKSLSWEAQMEMQGTPISMTQKVMSPDKFLMSVMVPQMGEVQRMVVNGTKGTMSGMGQTQDMPAELLEGYLNQADLQSPLHPEKAGTLTLTGIEKVDGKDCYVIEEKSAKGDKTVSYFDKASGLLVKTVGSIQGMTQTVYLKDYKEVVNGNGYKAAHKMKIESSQGAQEIEFSKIEANGKVKESDFK